MNYNDTCVRACVRACVCDNRDSCITNRSDEVNNPKKSYIVLSIT